MAPRISSILGAAGLGAAAMYLFDPDRGNRRRALIVDQVARAISKTRKGADVAWRDLRNRAYGTAAELRSSFASDRASNDVLVARVRSKIGRYVSHPSSIEVATHDGCVTLKGVVLTHEVDDLLAAVKSVRGVRDLDNQLEIHKTPEDISGLQGGVRRAGESAELMQDNWSPTARLGAGTVGGLLMATCIGRRTPGALVLGTIGFGLAARALANIETKRLFGFSPGRRGIDVQKTIVIEAPVEKVFALLADPTSYPNFTDTITSVRELEQDHYQKTLVGPAGVELMLDEIVTRSVPDEEFAWKSGPNSSIKFAGCMRFVPLGDSRTQVQVQATYNPPGGVLSHSAAWLAGLDPKSQLDDMLVRAKTYLEMGRQPHDAADKTPIEAEHGYVMAKRS